VWRSLLTTAQPDVRPDQEQLWQIKAMYARPHLPQGAPTSPALANLCSYRMDCRLHGLAQHAGAIYTRYADDLAFSGGEIFARGITRFSAYVAEILNEEGFAVNHRKTRIMRASVRQHLAGMVTNQRLNVPRMEFDLLKATLTNCVRHTPAAQNREGHPHFREHLAGRISFLESIHPEKGRRLRALFDEIQWE
jgi:RNA-directed DNA polymerase